MTLLSILFKQPVLFVAMILIFLFALSLHEFAHALASYWLGDTTAKRMNRLTLNPAAHVDMLGFIALITVGFGWGKPVPFNPQNLRNRRWGPALIGAAGPFSNLLFGTLCALLYSFFLTTLGPDNLLVITLVYGAHLNFLLLFFNLIPIPPLDGSKALLALLSGPRFQHARQTLETQGPFLLMGLIVLDLILGIGIFSFVGDTATKLVIAISRV